MLRKECVVAGIGGCSCRVQSRWPDTEGRYRSASSQLNDGFVATGTVTLTFTGSAPPSGSRLNFTITAGNATCTEEAVAFIWADHLNTPRQITKANQQAIWKWDSLPFGETLPNENPSGLGRFTFNHRFPGQYFDQETGLNQNWHREYDPAIGRYITSDPLGRLAGSNSFAYAKSSPSDSIDPDGLLTDCQMRWLNETYGTFGGFLVDLFNFQQYSPLDGQGNVVMNDELAAAYRTLLEAGGVKFGGLEALVYGGRALYSCSTLRLRNAGFGTLNAALGSTLRAGVSSVFFGSFGTAAYALSYSACQGH